MMRISSGISSQFNSANAQTSTNHQVKIPTIASQVEQVLFGKPKPTILNPAQFPQLAEQMQLLNKYRKKLAHMAGEHDDDYNIQLADDTIAMIDASGTIFVGVHFLHKFYDQKEVLVGVLAHEIGHRPKRWKNYKTQKRLTHKELQELCRFEETRADIFSGKGLAEMKMSPEPLIDFLLKLEKGPHPEYFSAKVRAKVIRESYASRVYYTKARKALFPEYERMFSSNLYLAEH